MTDVRILVTGPEIMRSGVRGTEPVVVEMLRDASDEIVIVAYIFSTHAEHILDLIECAASKGVNIKIIINNINSQATTIVERLKKLTSEYRHVKIFNFLDPQNRPLHAKIIIVDRRKALVGSANLSWGGMYKNFEIGLLIEGPAAWELARVVDDLTLLAEEL